MFLPIAPGFAFSQVDKHDKNKDSKLDDAEMLALLKEATGSDNITQEDVKRVKVCLLPPPSCVLIAWFSSLSSPHFLAQSPSNADRSGIPGRMTATMFIIFAAHTRVLLQKCLLS